MEQATEPFSVRWLVPLNSTISVMFYLAALGFGAGRLPREEVFLAGADPFIAPASCAAVGRVGPFFRV